MFSDCVSQYFALPWDCNVWLLICTSGYLFQSRHGHQTDHAVYDRTSGQQLLLEEIALKTSLFIYAATKARSVTLNLACVHGNSNAL